MSTSTSKEKYPGMKALATKMFAECPVSGHGELSRQMKFFLESAKSRGIATQLDWANQSRKSLSKMFGSPESLEVTPSTVSTISTKVQAANKNGVKIRKIEAKANNNDMKYLRTNDRSNKPLAEVDKSQFTFQKLGLAANNKSTIENVSGSSEVSNTNIKSHLPSGTIKRSPNSEYSFPTISKEDQRKSRFQSNSTSPSNFLPYSNEQITHIIVGTNESLEKPFFRLTGQVNPAVVRPAWVLSKSLSFVLEKYFADKGYSYLTSQLQSIRQDLTVQHIENELTIQVYEIHTRIALFHDDLGEFNKCLTKVRELHDKYPEISTNLAEFKAYSCYYMLLLRKWDELTLFMQSIDTTRAYAPNNDNFIKGEFGMSNSKELPDKFMLDRNLFPQQKAQQLSMLDRALVCVHKIQQQELLSLVNENKRAWPLELKLLSIILNRERARALEGLLSSTQQQKQSLPVLEVSKWLGCNKKQTSSLLKSWRIPVVKQQISSEQALPFIRQIVANLGGVFDIKGQK